MRRSLALLAALALLASCGQATTTTSDSKPAETSAVAADDPVFCAEIARRVSQTQCDTYVELARSATRGTAAFNAPSPMRRGETHVLQLAISAAPPAPDASDTTASAETPAEIVDPLPGETVEFKPLVGRFMRAELRGVGFAITPQSPAMQEVTPGGAATWSWQVVARQGGERALTLTTVVEGCTEDHSECIPLRSTTHNYTVQVEVAPLDQARDFLTGLPDWIKLASAIIGALAGLAVAFFALRNAFRRRNA